MTGFSKACILGRLGRDPEVRNLPSGGKVVSFSVATSDEWNDKASGERKSRVTWTNIVIFDEKIGEVAEKYLQKGREVYLEGSIETRKYEKDGGERTVTEIVMRPFRSTLQLIGGKPDSDGNDDRAERGSTPGGGYGAGRNKAGGGWDKPQGGSTGGAGYDDDLNNDIPFMKQWQ